MSVWQLLPKACPQPRAARVQRMWRRMLARASARLLRGHFPLVLLFLSGVTRRVVIEKLRTTVTKLGCATDRYIVTRTAVTRATVTASRSRPSTPAHIAELPSFQNQKVCVRVILTRHSTYSYTPHPPIHNTHWARGNTNTRAPRPLRHASHARISHTQLQP